MPDSKVSTIDPKTARNKNISSSPFEAQKHVIFRVGDWHRKFRFFNG